MGALLSRLGWISKAKTSKYLNKAEAAPEMLDYAYERMLMDYGKVKEGLHAVVATKHRMAAQCGQMRAEIPRLQANAESAFSKERPDLARSFVERKIALENRLNSHLEQLGALETDQSKLTSGAQQLQIRLQEMRDLRTDLKARMQSAAARTEIGKALAGISSNMGNTHRVIELIRDNIERNESEAYALDELLADGTFSDPLSLTSHTDRELLALESADRVETELAALDAGRSPKELTS